MSVPFSNTHLRVPRGFGTILEGLAREILRDQPEDIPKYATQYLEALLKQREESGMDPAEWAARLEDRFYNNHAFKTTDVSPGREPALEVAISREQSRTEDESSHLAEASNLSTRQPNISEDLTETTEDEEKHDITEKHFISVEEEKLSEGESINRLSATDVSANELSGTEEEKHPTINTVDREAKEKDGSPGPNQDICQSEPVSTNLLSLSGDTDVDVCAQELGLAEDELGDRQDSAGANKEIGDLGKKENTEAEEPVEVSSNPGHTDVDVCAIELSETERSMVIATVEIDAHVVEEESLNLQPEETLAQSSLSHFETPEGDQADKTKEEEGAETEAFFGETHQSVVHTEGDLDSNDIPKENSLVEISFEDVPEAQQITEVGEKQLEEEGSVEVLQTQILEVQQEEESNYVSAVETDQNISGPQHHEGPEMDRVEKELNSEKEEMENQHGVAAVMNAKVETNASNLHNSDDDDDGDDDDDDEKEEGVSSSYQQTTKENKENPEDETDHTNQDDRKIGEVQFHQNEDTKAETMSDPDCKDGESADAVGGDEEDMQTEGYSQLEAEDINDGSVDNHSSQVKQSNPSAEAESETLEASVLLSEESQKSLVESQSEDTVEEKQVTSKEVEEAVEEGKTDSEVQEKSDAMCEEEEEEKSTSASHSADGTAAGPQEEERPLGSEKDATEPGDKSNYKEECSRPQEEEDIMDIPLDDPEANRAAAKIQAGFRGHMTRKKMKPEDKAEGEEVSSTGDVLNGSQGDTEAGGSGAVEGDDTSVPEQ